MSRCSLAVVLSGLCNQAGAITIPPRGTSHGVCEMSEQESPIPSPRRFKMVLGDARFRYYPLWDVRKSDVFGYLCKASWDIGSGRSLVEDELPSAFESLADLIALDLETLHKALELVKKLATQYCVGGVLKVMVPVHYRTLVDPEVSEVYARECNTLVWSAWDDIYFEIVKPPALIGKRDLDQAMGVIRPFAQAHLLTAGLDFASFDAIADNAFLSVGADLSLDSRSEETIGAGLNAFTGRAKRAGLQTHAYGLKSVALSAAAVNAGFDFIGSDQVAGPLEEGEGIEDKPQFLGLMQALLASKKEG